MIPRSLNSKIIVIKNLMKDIKNYDFLNEKTFQDVRFSILNVLITKKIKINKIF